MSIDFDSGALAIQHEEEVYDQEDYEREQELHQLLTDLPDDMLEDSRDISSPELNYSGCSANSGTGRVQQTWEQKQDWSRHQEVSSNPGAKDACFTTDYTLHNGHNGEYDDHYGCDQYQTDYMYNQEDEQVKEHEPQVDNELQHNRWSDSHKLEEHQCTYEKGGYSFPHANSNEAPGENCMNGDSYESDYYHLPNSYLQAGGYNNGICKSNGQNGFGNHLGKIPDYHPNQRVLQHFIAPEHAATETPDSYKVKYNPYPAAHPPRGNFNPDETKEADKGFDQMQKDFLNTGESSAEAHQFAQLQILYNARGRQLDELQQKLEERARDIRYLNHQLAIVKGEKDGLALRSQNSQTLLQDAKELEVKLQGEIKALEAKVQGLTISEEESMKNMKIAEAAMDSMQQQMLELRRSESLTRAREQHDNVIGVLKQKHDETILAMQQKLDAACSALEEQKDNCKRLEEQVKQLERQQEEAKLEKAEIINGLTKSLEASQLQCRELLQTGSMQEITQLRIKLQQVQSAKKISDSMNKALQEEMTDFKEQISLYESAAKIDAFIKETPDQTEALLTDSYVDLGIKKGNWKVPRFQSTVRREDSDKMSKDEVILDLKVELERSLSIIKTKRQQLIQLQNEAKERQKQIAELKEQLENTEKTARNHEVRACALEKQLEALGPYSSTSEKALREEIERLQSGKQVLFEKIEEGQQQIEKLTGSEKQFKEANQELYSEMRQMIQEFNQNKQEAIERCERIYQQHHEDSKYRLQQELHEQHELEKAQLIQLYEEQITQLTTKLDQLNKEMSGVQECYITICKDKDSLESRLKEEMAHILRTTELEVKDQAIQAVEGEWQFNRDRTIEEIKRKYSPEKKQNCQNDQTCQTKLSSDTEIYTRQELETRLASQQLMLEQQSQEQRIRAVGEALKQLELTLEKDHEENVAKQVEMAVTKARKHWLQELTSLPEYRNHLQTEKEKWESEHEQDAAKQISMIFKANEDKWKKHSVKESEQAGSSVKISELQEKILALEHELDLVKEKDAAFTKAELAKARAQWNKEKSEEINRIQELNEKDYQVFLAEHRNKLNEILKKTKEDFIQQRNELLAQKESELNQHFLKKQNEWSAQQAEKIHLERQRCECEIIAELEHLVSEIPEHLIVESETQCFRMKGYSNTFRNSTNASLDYVNDCLHKACRKMVEKILQTINEKESKLDLQDALQESKRQHEEYKSEKEAQLRKFILSELQLRQKLERLENSLGQETKTKDDPGFEKNNLKPGHWQCGENCRLQIQALQQESQHLKKKLEKACKQLQLTVREHKTKEQHFKEEHEASVKLMQKANDDLVRRLKEESTGSKMNVRLQENCDFGKTDKNSSAKGLEEIRHQYLRAVDKIRGDMLCYIHESKERAAKMIRTEVLKERQQTARKMRKYYLTCLQQLLADSGKNEGAEKRIMSAASKLAAMAKALETPLPNRNRNKTEITNDHPGGKHSDQTPGIPKKNRLPNEADCNQVNHIESQSSSEKQARKCLKPGAPNTINKEFVPHHFNKVLSLATVQNGTSGEELFTKRNQGDACAVDRNPGLSEFQNTTFKTKDGHQMNGAVVTNVQKPKLHKAASVSHHYDLASYHPQMSLSKAHMFSSIDSLSDGSELHLTHESQSLIPKTKHLHYSSEEHLSFKNLAGVSLNVHETPERDESGCLTSIEDKGLYTLESLDFWKTEGILCQPHSSTTNVRVELGANALALPGGHLLHKTVSLSRDTPRMPTSIESLSSEVSSLSDGEGTRFSAMTTQVKSAQHTDIIQNLAQGSRTVHSGEQLITRPQKYLCNTESALDSRTAKLAKSDCGKQHIPKRCTSHLISNLHVRQQDSGFDSPFFDFH
ncbi:centrosomal protein of 152 kDa isoform X1 [Callorhinchus milii]|uniref:centrosomal protein of 152 kDa isoform X1 n=1 Tax=Callorhinchus milii TaxID=7868 RepID=UPI001C3FC112|nr:centrosomal protein of 152 kDa isoform X1 [Callorhinchus milii]